MKSALNIKRYIPSIISAIIFLLFWELFVGYFKISEWLLPAPSRIIMAIYRSRVLLLQHSVRTIIEAVSGLILASIAGTIIGGSLFHFPLLKKVFYPYLLISQTVPIVVLIPLLVIWLGYGVLPKLIIVILACFFPIAVNTVDGLFAADLEMLNLLRSMGATDWQVFKMVRIPVALPMIFSGLRIGATYAVMAAVVAEWMGSDMGLGVFILRSSNSYLTAQVFAGIVLISIYSIVFFQLVNYLEKIFVPWSNKIT